MPTYTPEQRSWRKALRLVGLIALIGATAAALLLIRPRGPSIDGPARGDPPSAQGPDITREPSAILAGRARPAEDAVPEPVPTTPSAAQPHLLTGRVVDDADHPIHNALVYLLPKQARGLRDPSLVQHLGTDEDGRWAFPEDTRTENRWLCAIRDEYLPTYVDASELVADKPLTLRLVPGGVILVQIVGGNAESHLATSVRADGDDAVDSFPLPGPNATPRPIVIVPIINDTRGALRVGTRGPVVVRASRWGHFANPEFVRLPRPEGQVDFEFIESCLLQVRVSTAESGEPIITGFTAELLDPANGTMLAAEIATSPDGIALFRNNLRPGEYDLRVSAKGRLPSVLKGLKLTAPGRRESVAVRLEPDLATAGVRLHWAPSKVAHECLSFLVYWRDQAGSPNAWRAAGEGSRPHSEIDECHVAGIPPGRHDLIVIDPKSGECAFVPSIDVRLGELTSTAFEWRTGTMLAVSEFVGEGTDKVHLEVRSTTAGQLPLVQAKQGATIFFLPNQPIARRSVLGPYPFSSLQVRWAIDAVGPWTQLEKKEESH